MRGRPVVVAGDKPAAAEDMQPVGKLVDFRQVGRDEDDAGALLEKFAEQAVDFRLGANVDADGRLVEDEEPRAVAQPLADDDLLLVAAGHGGSKHATRRRLDAEIADLPVGVGRLVTLADHQARTQLAEDRQVDVEAYRQVEAQALVAAAFRRKRDTEIHRLALVADIDLVAVPEDFPGGKRLAAIETKRELAAAGADKA